MRVGESEPYTKILEELPAMRREPLQLRRQAAPQYLALPVYIFPGQHWIFQPKLGIHPVLWTVSPQVFYGRTSSVGDQRMSWQREMKKD